MVLSNPFKKVPLQKLAAETVSTVKKQYAPTESAATRLSQELTKRRPISNAIRKQRMIMLNRQRELLAAMKRGEEIQQQTPNKFDMIVAARAKRLNEMDARRRFHAPDKNHAAKMNMIHQREMARRRDDEQRNSLLKAHENMMDVKMDFLETQNGILMAENVFSNTNPRKMDINRTGRPNVLQLPKEENLMNTKLRLKFF